METCERQAVVEALNTSETRLLELVSGLTDEQWRFREAPERWSIAEIVEHLVLQEAFVRGTVRQMLAGEAASEEQRAAVRAKEPLVAGLARRRAEQRLKSRAVNTPTGQRSDFDALVDELRRERAQTIAFAEETLVDLRGHFFAHVAFGDLDGYQWLMLLATHMDRHALQIEQVKADMNWPGVSRYSRETATGV